MLVDADDELIGRNVLKVFNWARQTKSPGVTYSNYLTYKKTRYLNPGFSTFYTNEERIKNKYRNTRMKFMKVEVYLNSLFLEVDPNDLKDDSGAFYLTTYDYAMFYPLLELSCGRVLHIDGEYQYLYNIGTGLNDNSVHSKEQVLVGNEI